MQAICLERPGFFTRIAVDEPSPPRPRRGSRRGSAASASAGRTWVAATLAKCPSTATRASCLGHELGVEVLAVGPGVTSVATGDRCSVRATLNCQTCFALPPAAG